MEALNEQNLVTRLHNDDPTAFDDLYRQYSGYVAFICLKFCDNKEDAEEAIQDTFLDIHAKAKTLRADTLRALIRRIAVCKCYRKRNQSRQLQAIRVDIDFTTQEEHDNDFLPEQYLHNKEQRTELLRIIMALPKMQWETVYLYYYASFGTEEIARLQNCSTSNVRKTLRNARTAIKDRLEGKQKGKILKPLVGIASVSLAAVLLAEEQVFAATYVSAVYVSASCASTGAIAATTAAAGTGTLAVVKGCVAAACVVTLVAVSAATYYILWQDEPPPSLPTVQAVAAPILPEPTTTTPPATPPPMTTPPITSAPTTPPPTTTPETTPIITTPQPTVAPTEAPTSPPTTTPAPPPAPIDNTQAILAALANATTAQDIAHIIAQYHFRYDQLIRSGDYIFRFYVTNQGSGDILIGIATDEYGNFQRLRYALFADDVIPNNVIALLRFID